MQAIFIKKTTRGIANCKRILFYLFLATPFFTLSQVKDTARISEYSTAVKNRDVSIIIKSNLFPIAISTIPFAGEYRLVAEYTTSPFNSTLVGVSYLGKGLVTYFIEDIMKQNGVTSSLIVSGFRLQAAYKIYPKSINSIFESAGLIPTWLPPYGFYIAPHFSYTTAKITTSYLNQYNSSLSFTHMNANVLIGYQQLVFKRVAFDIFFGMGYKKNVIDKPTISSTLLARLEDYFVPTSKNIITDYYYSPVKILLGMNVGIGF